MRKNNLIFMLFSYFTVEDLCIYLTTQLDCETGSEINIFISSISPSSCSADFEKLDKKDKLDNIMGKKLHMQKEVCIVSV